MTVREEKRNLETIPVGPLGLIPLPSCREIGDKVDEYLVKWRKERENAHKNTLSFAGYQRDTFIMEHKLPRKRTHDGNKCSNRNQNTDQRNVWHLEDRHRYRKQAAKDTNFHTLSGEEI